jgi:membrane protein YdbS with pleckstrin-like domain
VPVQDFIEAEGPAPADAAMMPLHPSQKHVLRIRALMVGAVLLAAALLADLGPLRDTPVPAWLVPGIALLLAAWGVLVLPARRYRAWGFAEGADELAVRNGLWTKRRTIVPFGRVQHIDIAQGPLQRRFRLGTLVLHTAGTHGAAVALPGILHADAEAMRDRIRAKIRQDLV